MSLDDTPLPEDSAGIIAQDIRRALKAAGFKRRTDYYVRRDNGGPAAIITVTIQRLGVVRAKVESAVMPFERVHRDERGRARIDVRHVYVRVEYLPALLEPFRLEARRVLQALTRTGQRLQMADYLVTLKADGFLVSALDTARRTMVPVGFRSIEDAARALAELVVSDGWQVKVPARLL